MTPVRSGGDATSHRRLVPLTTLAWRCAVAAPQDTTWLESISREDLIYFAGFFDGEGTIGIYLGASRASYKSPRHQLSIGITNTNLDVMLWIGRRFRGTLSERKVAAGCKRAWAWNARSRYAAAILAAVEPFLIVKREEAVLAIQFASLTRASRSKPRPAHRGMPRLSAEDISARVELARQVAALKKREWPLVEAISSLRKER